MPPRISRGAVSAPTRKNAPRKRGSTKRSLNAFAIAAEQVPENSKIRKSRLGQLEDDGPRQKRRRVEEEEADGSNSDAENGGRKEARTDRRGAKQSTLDISDGEDSEGHTWKYGQIDEDDDSEIDSDEAFGSSDEERFAGFAFSGSTKNRNKRQGAKASSSPRRQATTLDDIDLNEGGEVSEPDSGDDEESLGEDAVDLATMLDNYKSSDDEEGEEADDSDEKSGSAESEEGTPPSDYSMSDTDDDDAGRSAQLQDLVTTLHPESRSSRKQPTVDSHEAQQASTAGLVASEKFDIMDILANTSDQTLKQVVKQTGNLPRQLKKDLKLQPSLPKRQRDQLERKAASKEAKATLQRWVDTVKHNREAEHLSFPLADPNGGDAGKGQTSMTNVGTAPMTDLESAIQNILKESGLVQKGQSVEEKEMQAFEDLQVKAMPLEEAEARRAELRKSRDLMFREEAKSKRIKKIKSKSYRRVHRREREKLAARERDAFADGAEGLDEEEREEHDRRRAEDRMSTKHKNSKWAKQLKKSGRATWDEDARTGVSDMARRNEELRRRIEGKEVRHDEDDADTETSDDDASIGSNSETEDEKAALERDLLKMWGKSEETGNRITNLEFMKRAEAKRAAANEAEVVRMRREMNGEQSSSDSEESTIGRKLFAPKHDQPEPENNTAEQRNEFEEKSDHDDDELDVGFAASSLPVKPRRSQLKTGPEHEGVLLDTVIKGNTDTGRGKQGKFIAKSKGSSAGGVTDLRMHKGEKHSQPDADGWQTVTYTNDNNSDDDNEDRIEAEQAQFSDADVIRNAFFAGDEVEAAFQVEKHEVMNEESEKVVDNTIPGWGSWVGSDVTKREQRKNKNRVLVTQPGIKPADRKDSKLKHVIINQRRQKKTVPYMASQLPFPFQNKQEYERSIRMPIGGDWNVREAFHANTKPRVLIKPGAIIAPMQKPLL